MESPSVWSKNAVFLFHANLMRLAARYEGEVFGIKITPENQPRLALSPSRFFLSVQESQTILIHLTLGGRTFTAVKRFGDLHPLSTYYLAFLHNKDISKPLIVVDRARIEKEEVSHVRTLLLDAQTMYHQMLLHLIFLFGFEDAYIAHRLPEEVEVSLKHQILFNVDIDLKKTSSNAFGGMGNPIKRLAVFGFGDRPLRSKRGEILTLFDLFVFTQDHQPKGEMPSTITRGLQSSGEYGYVTLIPVPTWILSHVSIDKREVNRLIIGVPVNTEDNSETLFPRHINEELHNALNFFYSPSDDISQINTRVLDGMDIDISLEKGDSRKRDPLLDYDYMNLVCMLVEPMGTSIHTAQFAIRALPSRWWEALKKDVLNKGIIGEDEGDKLVDYLMTPQVIAQSFDTGSELYEQTNELRTIFSSFDLLRLQSFDLSRTLTVFRILEMNTRKLPRKQSRVAAATALPEDIVMSD